MKHTKGPWKTEKTGLIYQEATNRGVARLVSIGTEQDAHLIAAAPEMLEALELLMRSMLEPRENTRLSIATLGQIQDVIRKAKGGA